MKISQVSTLVMVLTLTVFLSSCAGPSIPSSTPTPVASTAPTLQPTNTLTVTNLNPGKSPIDVAYLINNQVVQLSDGKAKEPVPGSSSVVQTEVFGKPVTGDLNGDTILDAAVILVQSSGGSGMFFYVAAVLVQADGTYLATNAVFVGDRIAPQTTSIANQTITFNYATRAKDEPMTAQPSQAVSAYFQVLNGTLLQLPTELPAPNP